MVTPPGTRARSWTARRRCSSRARSVPPSSGSSRAPLRLVRPRRRRPVPDAARQPAGVRAGAREGGLTWDDMAVIEVNEAFASVVLQFLKDTGLERWRRREPERRRHLARPPARCDRRAHHRHAPERARAARRPLRHRHDVHRPGPGHRRCRRARLTRWLLVRGRGDRPLDRHVRPEEIAAHSSSKRPSLEPGELAILYASVWQAVFGVPGRAGGPEPHAPGPGARPDPSARRRLRPRAGARGRGGRHLPAEPLAPLVHPV